MCPNDVVCVVGESRRLTGQILLIEGLNGANFCGLPRKSARDKSGPLWLLLRRMLGLHASYTSVSNAKSDLCPR